MPRIPGRRLFFSSSSSSVQQRPPSPPQQPDSSLLLPVYLWQWLKFFVESHRYGELHDHHYTSSSSSSSSSSTSSPSQQQQQHHQSKRNRYFIFFLTTIFIFSSFLFLDEELTLSFFVKRNPNPLSSSSSSSSSSSASSASSLSRKSHSIFLNATIPIEDYQRLSDRFWTENINVDSDSNCEFIPQTSISIEKITSFETCPPPSLPPSASLSDLQFHHGSLSFSYSSTLYGLNLQLSTIDEQHDHSHLFNSAHELQRLIYHSSSKVHRYHPRKKDKNWAHMHKIHTPFSWNIESEFVEFFLEPYDYDWGEGKIKSAGILPKSTIPFVLQSVIPRTTPSSSTSKRLPNILIISVDSVSRANFMRSLPKTAAVLRSVNSQRFESKHYAGKENTTHSPPSSSYMEKKQLYRSFVFNRFNAQQGTSAANLTPLLAGRSYDIEKLTERVWTTRTYSNPEVSKKDWIWNWLKTKGYVTMFGSDVLNEFLGAHLWDWTGFDHLAPVVEGDDNWIYDSSLEQEQEQEQGQEQELEKGQEQEQNQKQTQRQEHDSEGRGKKKKAFRRSKCVGGRHIHEYLTEYASSFWETYQEFEPSTPRFVYIHFNEAHIKDQFAVNVIDNSTSKLLEEILHPSSFSSSSSLFSEEKVQNKRKKGGEERELEFVRPTIVMVVSDHGREGGVEQQLPLLSFVLPLEVLASHSRLEQNLFDNQQRLVSGFDVYKTLKHLVTYLEKTEEGAEGGEGDPLIETQPQPHTHDKEKEKDTTQSLLLPISTSRSCEDAGLSSLACVCTLWRPVISPSSWAEGATQENLGLLRSLMRLVVEEVNEKTKFSRTVCRPLEVRLNDESIHSFEVTRPLSAVDFYKVVFSFLGSKTKHMVVASKFVDVEVNSEGKGWKNIEWLHQLTNHRVYQHCTPTGIDPEFCQCE